MTTELKNLQFSGEIKTDDAYKKMYATDASVYRKIPQAVAFPKNSKDIKTLIEFAGKNKTSLIPRTAGTSLAGQCVGEGIVVDTSKYLNQILSFDKENKTVTVEPGVVRDELNEFLNPYGLFFGPNTSTSNRCMIGGMVGNNSSGTTSIQYGVTREKVIQLDCILSDGSEVSFKALSKEEFEAKCRQTDLEGKIYRSILETFKSESVRKEIFNQFPKKEIHRRNTGYAIDLIADSEIFENNTKKFNLCQLLSGSEGTLAFTTKITLQLEELPPTHSRMIASHYQSIEKCLNDVENAMSENLFTCEMMDKTILDCTKNNLSQEKNRFFIQGDPMAILMLEIRDSSEEKVEQLQQKLVQKLLDSKMSYAQVPLKGNEINQAMELRKAGLGLLGNIIGDKKTVACIEDTAVALSDLSNFIKEFTDLMDGYNQPAVYYAHAGAGELHLRPILNLKKSEDIKLFKSITNDVAHLTKKYNGSFSGEHGDGIVRAEFLPLMIGDKNYELCKQIKHLFDPENIFNPGKIVDPYPMDKSFRYEPDRLEPEIETFMNFSDTQGILRAVEKCNGSGDCRKDTFAGGTMCPSFRATKDEKEVTRGRANILREFLTNSQKKNPFNNEEIKDALDLCIGCKACSSECPSSIDMATYKSEFLYQYQKSNGFSKRNKRFAFNTKNAKKTSRIPKLSNQLLEQKWFKKRLGIHPDRNPPKIHKSVFEDIQNQIQVLTNPIKSVYLFLDEFSEFNDGKITKSVVHLLTKLNYQVILKKHFESGRTFISKGFLEEAKICANDNIDLFSDLVTNETPLIGIEPSAILSFRDEYLRLADDIKKAEELASNTFLLEEFFTNEIKQGNITCESFSDKLVSVKIHNHCHQKALSNQKDTYDILNLPSNFKPSIIPSGCCGMAGSFGYELEHYDISMQIGNQTLFPSVKNADENTIIIANGTSCRHQIKDGTGKTAIHWAELLEKEVI